MKAVVKKRVKLMIFDIKEGLLGPKTGQNDGVAVTDWLTV
jgi:hypothetical protein